MDETTARVLFTATVLIGLIGVFSEYPFETLNLGRYLVAGEVFERVLSALWCVKAEQFRSPGHYRQHPVKGVQVAAYRLVPYSTL